MLELLHRHLSACFSYQLACLSLLLDAEIPSKSNSLFKRNNIMKIQRSAIQFKYSDKFAKAVGLPPASTATRPRKRDLSALQKITAILMKKKYSKQGSFDFRKYHKGLPRMQRAKKAEDPKAASAMETIGENPTFAAGEYVTDEGAIGENVADEGVKVRRCHAELQSSLDGQYWTMQPTTGRAGRKRTQTVFFSPSC